MHYFVFGYLCTSISNDFHNFTHASYQFRLLFYLIRPSIQAINFASTSEHFGSSLYHNTSEQTGGGRLQALRCGSTAHHYRKFVVPLKPWTVTFLLTVQRKNLPGTMDGLVNCFLTCLAFKCSGREKLYGRWRGYHMGGTSNRGHDAGSGLEPCKM